MSAKPRLSHHAADHILSMTGIGLDGRAVTIMVTGGYEKDGEHRYIGWKAGSLDETSETIYSLRGGKLVFSGGMVQGSWERYNNAGEGDAFSYRQWHYRRLTAAEILEDFGLAPIMNEVAIRKMDELDAAHATARARVLQSLSGEASAPQDVLLRWIIENGTNPNTVFAPKWAADAFSTFEGMESLLHYFNYALEDDGDVSFVACATSEPKIIFLDHREDGFRDAFMRLVGEGRDPWVVDIFEPIGVLPDVATYISAYEEHQKKQALMFECPCRPV
ncbi:hypothetical protein ACEUZ9_000990 [Paracoccus litorisediminis]|uniref:hypothetical protein n=1 Tax=Paracoccus litorisediminis TaxID=2006130 RepID=UPI00372E3631